MPTYEYELCEGDCKICKGGFTLRRPLDAPALTKCPLCRKPVRKIISSTSSPKLLAPISAAEAKSKGFTIYKKIGKGEYERQ